MAAVTLFATRGRNVTPTTTTLSMLAEDVDCSDAAFDAPPLDGQFVQAVGPIAANGHDDAHEDNTTATVAAIVADQGLAMVWGSSKRSDRSALSETRVPVIRNGGRFKTKAFILADSGKIPSDTNGYVGGALLTVDSSTNTIEGSADRMFLIPLTANTGWAVGYVVRVITDSKVAGTGEIEVMLYDKPRLTTIA